MTQSIKELKAQYQTDYNKLLKDNQVFFAFDKDQFNEGIKGLNLIEGQKVSRIGVGSNGYLPSKNKENFMSGSKELEDNHIKDVKSLKDQHDQMILDTIYNYEAFYSGDLSDVYDDLKCYGITMEKIQNVYRNNLYKFDL